MKWQRVLVAVLLGLLMWRTPATAQGIYFENEGLLVPSEKSQSVFDPALSRAMALQAVEGRIEVFPDAVDFPNIVVITTIRDAEGNPVRGLGPEDVTVTEQSDKESLPVVEIPTCFEEIADEGGIAFSLTFDVSYSMSANNKLTEAKAASNLFLDVANDADLGSVVSFAGCKQVNTPFPLAPIDQDLNGDGKPDIQESIDKLTALGSTAVYDGIAQAVATLAGVSAPKGAVVLTDGMTNNDCTDTINSVIEKARAADVSVYTIGLDIPADSIMAENLKIIAEMTGGSFSLAATPEELAAIYLKIAGDIRAQYRICYTTHNPAFDGTTRTVTVRYDNAEGSGTYTVGTVPGNQPPVIVHDPVTSADENIKVTIEALVTDPDKGDAVEKVALFYRMHTDSPEAPFTEIPMKAGDQPDAYSAIIPGSQVIPPGLDYYISAWDKTGARTDSGSPADPYIIAVIPNGPPQNQPPKIEHDPVTMAKADTQVPISATVTDTDDAVAQVTLFFRMHADGPDAPFNELAMTASAGADDYSAEIPKEQVAVPGVDYYISAWDENGARTDSGSPADPYFIQVALQPVADAGPDQIVEERETVTLDGGNSSSGIEGEAPRFFWRQTMGPVVDLNKASSAQPTFTSPGVDLTETVLIFELTVTNSLGESASDSVWVTIEKDAGCKSGDCGGGSGGCFIDTVSTAPGWLRGLFR